MLVVYLTAFPASTSFKEEFSSVDPRAVEPDEEFREDDDDKRGPKEVWRPKEGTPEMAPTTESGTLASERHVGARAEDDSGGVESEAHASVRRDLPSK